MNEQDLFILAQRTNTQFILNMDKYIQSVWDKWQAIDEALDPIGYTRAEGFLLGLLSYRDSMALFWGLPTLRPDFPNEGEQ